MSTVKIFDGVTLHGMPVHIEVQWPFHPSGGGGDSYVVHGTLLLADGGPLRADLALNMSQTIREALPSVDGELAWWVAVNTARKELDDKQLELLKTGKRQPVPLTSRCYSIRHQQFTFWHVKLEQVDEFVARKIFWVSGSERRRVLVADPCDTLYLDASDEQMLDKLRDAAKRLAARGLAEMAGDEARATDALLAQAATFQAAKDHALEELHSKHAFERA